MPLQAKLQVESTDLLFQQNSRCLYTLSNPGSTEMMVPAPRLNGDVPRVRVTAIATGVEEWHTGKPPMSGPVMMKLKAGASYDTRFMLTDLAHFHAPGEYDVACAIEVGKDSTLTGNVRLKMAPVTPRNICRAPVNGGLAAMSYSVSVNRAADPPVLVRHQIYMLESGGVTDACPLVPINPDIHPILSTGANRSVSHSHWIAWSEADKLHALHVLHDGSFTKPRQTPFPQPGCVLVSPMSIRTGGDPAARADGTALVFAPALAGPGGVFHVVTLRADADPVFGATLPLAGAKPSWIKSVERSDASRWIVFAQADSKGAGVYMLPWPDQVGSSPQATATPRKLGTFSGDVLAGDAAFDLDDTLLVSVLVMDDPSSTRAVKLPTWTMAKDAAPEAGPVHPVPWPSDTIVASASVRFGLTGEPAALIGSGASWSVFCPSVGYRPAPGSVSLGTCVDLAFLGPAPAFIVGRPKLGLDILQLSGDPLPRSCG